MKQYDLSTFEWFVPKPKSKYCITFLREGMVNVNAALLADLPDVIEIGFHPSEKVICLRGTSNPNGIRLPASGTISSPEFSARLIEKGFSCPVRLLVEKGEGGWFAVPDSKPLVLREVPARPPESRVNWMSKN